MAAIQLPESRYLQKQRFRCRKQWITRGPPLRVGYAPNGAIGASWRSGQAWPVTNRDLSIKHQFTRPGIGSESDTSAPALPSRRRHSLKVVIDMDNSRVSNRLGSDTSSILERLASKLIASMSESEPRRPCGFLRCARAAFGARGHGRSPMPVARM